MAQLTLATYQLYDSIIHGGTDVNNGKLLVLYEYNLEEFYNNSWKSEIKFYKKQMNRRYNMNHDLLRNYNKIMKKTNIELVEICEDENNVMYCILHTYKINILKRKWKSTRLIN